MTGFAVRQGKAGRGVADLQGAFGDAGSDLRLDRLTHQRVLLFCECERQLAGFELRFEGIEFVLQCHAFS